MTRERPHLIGELINSGYARARRAWIARDLTAYANLAVHQEGLGAEYLTVNIDGTRDVAVRMEEMLDFLPGLVAALQKVTPLPLSFDNPALEFHEIALRSYDRTRSPRPIINSVAASRERLDDLIELVRERDTNVVIMASEKRTPGGSSQCLCAADIHAATREFFGLLTERGGRKPEQILVDPGLPPVGADTYGLVNAGLDAMELIQRDRDLRGIHVSVGLSNFGWGTPPAVRHKLEGAYVTLAMERGLDFVLGNPERRPEPLPPDDPFVAHLRAALESGRALPDETQETAGFRQAERIMELCGDPGA